PIFTALLPLSASILMSSPRVNSGSSVTLARRASFNLVDSRETCAGLAIHPLVSPIPFCSSVRSALMVAAHVRPFPVFIGFVGVAAFGLGLLSVFFRTPAPGAHAQGVVLNDCQPNPDGCWVS